MRSSKYWQDRFIELEQQLEQMAGKSFRDIQKVYTKAIADMDKELAAWYQRFADENGMTYAQAHQLLTSTEIKRFRLTLNQFLTEARKRKKSDTWRKKLENAYISLRVSRLQALEVLLEGYAEQVFDKEHNLFLESLKEQYTEGYYHTAFLLQKGVGVGHYLGGIDERKLSAILAHPWAPDGKNFSTRIWEHKQKLVKTLNTEMTQAVLRGEDYRRATATVAKRMHVAQSSAGRLIMTESAFLSAKSHQDCFQELGVEQYQFIATLDNRTSEICRDMDLKVYPMSAFRPGTTAPPMHCYCRSCTAPYFADAKDENRIARGQDGKTYMVPADMSYHEWQKKFVDGHQ